MKYYCYLILILILANQIIDQVREHIELMALI